MTYRDPNEPIPDEDTHCTGCGRDAPPEFPRVRYVFTRPNGSIRRGVFHFGCAPDDIDAWLARHSSTTTPERQSEEPR